MATKNPVVTSIEKTSKLNTLIIAYRDAYATLYQEEDLGTPGAIKDAKKNYIEAEKELYEYLRVVLPQEIPPSPQIETTWGLEFCQPGDVEIWYANKDFHASCTHDIDYLEAECPGSFKDLQENHVKLGSIKAEGVSFLKGEVNKFSIMNTFKHFSSWQHSSAGKAAIEKFCETLGVHVSMSVGDVIVHKDVMYVVSPTGFIEKGLRTSFGTRVMSFQEYLTWDWKYPDDPTTEIESQYKFCAVDSSGTIVVSCNKLSVVVGKAWGCTGPVLNTGIKVDLKDVDWKTTLQMREKYIKNLFVDLKDFKKNWNFNEGFPYAAIDQDGTIYEYKEPPDLERNRVAWQCEETGFRTTGYRVHTLLRDEWKKSLIKDKSKKE